MPNISIVTTFYDIGRGDWTPDKGLPHYLHRTTDTYVERFGHLATLENEITIFTSEDLIPKVKELRGDRPTNIIPVDYYKCFIEARNKISKVQRSEDYQSKINPYEKRNPEYWSADYVLVNALKSTFINNAKNNCLELEYLCYLTKLIENKINEMQKPLQQAIDDYKKALKLLAIAKAVEKKKAQQFEMKKIQQQQQGEQQLEKMRQQNQSEVLRLEL